MGIVSLLWHALAYTVVGIVLVWQVFSGTHITIVPSLPAAQRHRADTTGLFPVASTVQKTATSTPEQKASPLQIFQSIVQHVFTPTVPSSADIPAPKTPDQINAQTRTALVNILCVTKSGGYLHPISGSGVIIDGTGVILTSAHVGQYFLLRDYPTPGNVDCIVRTGSPAYPTYNAKLLYLPPVWVNANAAQIVAQDARGTGENDYSFLLVTSTTGGSPLPAAFAPVPITTNTPQRGDPVLLASYPAGFLEGSTITMSLYASSAFTTVAELFSFADLGTVDLLSVGGTVVSQAGSSGGAVVRQQDGALLGIIATATVGTTTASRDLHAITLAHIDRSLNAHGKGGLLQILSGDLQAKAAAFNATVAQTEKHQLIDVLEK
ncbi:MAG: serine protease [bacterium]|nr:serine protease [bacterium]